jgi:hypothetical protein
MQAFRAGIVPTRAVPAMLPGFCGSSYCATFSFDPMLSNVADPIPFLQVFVTRYCNGTLAPCGKSVHSGTVEAALRSIGQTMASMGAPDIQLNPQGQIHYILQQQLKGYTRADSPATRVKPIPFTIVDYTNLHATTTQDKATADIATISFFFLLRPGEHTHSFSGSDTQPFRLQDVTSRLGASTVNAATGPLHLISLATFVTLTFTKQKNGTESEVVGHARCSGHTRTCPALALIRRTLHLREHSAIPSTPLFSRNQRSCHSTHSYFALSSCGSGIISNSWFCTC